MKALMLTAYENMELQDAPTPEVGPKDVLVRVQACGICGSDIHGFDGSTGRRIPPLIMGHEAAGIVESIGTAVRGYSAGDRVTFDSMVSCGACYFCRRGQINLCDNRRVLGVSCGDYRQHGCFAEFVAVPEHIVYPIPDDLPFEHAAMIEAVSVAVHAAEITPVQLGDTAVIVGSGMIGLLTLQAIRLAGCSQIIAVDLNPKRLKMAKEFGADHTIHAGSEDVPARVRELTDGRGADVALEVVGATPTVEAAIESVRKGGMVTVVGNISPKIELPLQSVVTREIRVQGSCASSGEYPACIDLLTKGLIRVDPMITARIPLADGPEWFRRLHNGDPTAMKVMVCPGL